MATQPAVHCPTCGASWDQIAAYQCDGPADAPHPRVRTVPGPPPVSLRGRAVAVPEDHAAALAVVSDWTEGLGYQPPRTRDQLVLVGMIAAAIAEARHRDEPGERHRVTVNLRVHGGRWQDDPEGRRHSRMVLRSSWVKELERRDLEPLGWPPVLVRYWRWAALAALATIRPAPEGGPAGMDEVESAELADIVTLTIDGPAVKR